MKPREETIYLLFRAAGVEFALPVDAVRGMHWLPELAPARGLPGSVIGFFQRSGRAVPVIDPGRRFGDGGDTYHLTDIVIVTQTGKGYVGVLANEVKRLARGIQLLFDGPEMEKQASLIAGELDVDGDIAALIDPESLLTESSDGREAPHAFWPDASPEERDLLRRRAAALRHPVETGLHRGEDRLAIVRVGSELLALDMGQISQFAEIGPITPIPCTPAYVIGNTNLRGSIVTVLDLLATLGLGKSTTEKSGKLVVVQHEGLLAGFPVDEVRDLTDLEENRLKPSPDAPKFVKGEFLLDRGVATFVDLQRLLTAEELIVDEQVGG